VSHLHQSFYGPHIIPSFADRDIFARYTGVGVGHQAQYCPPASLNQETRSSSSTGLQDEYSDEDDSSTGNDGGEGPQSASTDEESEDSDHDDGVEDSVEPDEDVMDEDMSDKDDGENGFKF